MLLQFAKKVPSGMLVCKCEDCGNVFLGYPNSRYCELHTHKTIKKQKETRLYDDFVPLNLEITEKTTVARSCDCCGKEYRYDAYIDTKMIPRYCELHRNPYKRDFYNKYKRN